MKELAIFILIFGATKIHAQKIERIYANLYTDSLKKGTHNYINIDGKLSNGKYLPLDSTKILFKCSQATFFGNSLYIPTDFKEDKVHVTAILKSDTTKFEIFDLYIKKTEDPPLKSEKEVLAEIKKHRRKEG
ncbi:MAG: hypothetical protein ACKVOM_01325 [Ferruginibacter sp.]